MKDQKNDSEDYWDEAYTPFRYEENMGNLIDDDNRRLVRQEAIEAVNKAIDEYKNRSAVRKAYDAVRMFIYWQLYKLRLMIALFIIRNFGKKDNLQFAQRVLFKLGL